MELTPLQLELMIKAYVGTPFETLSDVTKDQMNELIELSLLCWHTPPYEHDVVNNISRVVITEYGKEYMDSIFAINPMFKEPPLKVPKHNSIERLFKSWVADIDEQPNIPLYMIVDNKLFKIVNITMDES